MSSRRLRGGAPEARSGGGQPPEQMRPSAPQVPAPASPALPPSAEGVIGRAWRTVRERPLLLPALALWGWQTDLLLPALVMGLLIEGHRLLPQRLDLQPPDFERLWNATAVLFLAVVFYLGFARQGLDGAAVLAGAAEDAAEGGRTDMRRVSDTALTFLRWLPFVVYPFTLIHAWSRTGTLPWSVFSLYEQARARRQPGVPPPEWTTWPMHPGYLYLGVVLFSSTTTVAHAALYLPLALAVTLLALWPVRARGHHPLTWLLALAAVGAVAAGARQGRLAVREAWMDLEQRLLATASGIGGTAAGSQQRSATAIGRIGALKQSHAIILRAATGDDEPPGLLREAAFTRYRDTVWDAPALPWSPPATAAMAAGARRMTATRWTADGAVPAALPGDTLQVRTPAPALVEATALGAVRLRGAPPIGAWEVESGPGGGLGEPPGPDDRKPARLAADDQAAVEAAVAEAGLAGQPAAAAVQRLEAWFARGFTYTLQQEPRPTGTGALAWFLRGTRSGHCEYYATCSVLMLRAAGIPARYAVGFSISERLGDEWVGRGRDAHAWCLVWLNGAWRDVDTTPGIWRGDPATAPPWWQGLSDRWSRAWYAFARWRQSGSTWRLLLIAAGLAVLMWIGWRQLRGGRWQQALGRRTPPPSLPGHDSELFPILARLAARHGPRPEHRTPADWIAGLALPAAAAAALAEAVALHQRLRFAPGGLAAAERERLRLRCREALAALAGRG